MSKEVLEILEDMSHIGMSVMFISTLISLFSLLFNKEYLFARSQLILLISSLSLIVIGIIGLIYKKKCQKQ